MFIDLIMLLERTTALIECVKMFIAFTMNNNAFIYYNHTIALYECKAL